MENLNIDHNLDLEILSPVSVLKGSVLSPLSDYFIYKGKCYYINQDKLAEVLLEKKLIDRYLVHTSNYHNVDKTDSIKDFFDEEGISVESVLNKSVNSFISSASTELHEIVETGGFAYIPGSSIKGAIATAFFYDYLIKGEGQKKLKKFYDGVVNKGSGRPKPEWKNLEKQFFGFIDGRKRMDFSLLKIGDTKVFGDQSLEVIKSEIVHLNPKESHKRDPESMLEIIQEAIVNGKQSFNIRISNSALDNRTPLNNGFLNFFKNQNLATLFQKINQFSLHALEIEKEFLEKIYSQEVKSIFKAYLENSNFIYESIKKRKPNEAFLRLGHRKGYFQNSIGLALYRIDKSFHKHLNIGKTGNSIFPITRGMRIETHEPLGWVKLTDLSGDYSNERVYAIESFNQINGNLLGQIDQKASKSYEIGKLSLGDRVVARVVELKRPHSLVTIQIKNGEIKVKMNGTKKMQRAGYGLNSLVPVKIIGFKENKITEVTFLEK